MFDTSSKRAVESEKARNLLRIVAAHNHALMRQAIVLALSETSQLILVAVVHDVVSAAHAIERERPDVLLINEWLAAQLSSAFLAEIASVTAIIMFASSPRARDPRITGVIPVTILPSQLGDEIRRLASKV